MLHDTGQDQFAQITTISQHDQLLRQVLTSGITINDNQGSHILADSAKADTTLAGNSQNLPVSSILADCSSLMVEPLLPFVDEDICVVHGIESPAKPLVKTSMLKDKVFVLPRNTEGEYDIFVDKVLPILTGELEPNEVYSPDYFVALHKLVSAPGTSYPEGTPNCLGARIPLQHTTLNLDSRTSVLTDDKIQTIIDQNSHPAAHCSYVF